MFRQDKKIRLLDPRADCCVAVSAHDRLPIVSTLMPRVLKEADGHLGVKESKVLFLGDTNYVITTGFSKVRGESVRCY